MKIGNGNTAADVSEVTNSQESALYREISKTRFEQQADVLDEMRRRLTELETLHARLSFMMGEISGLVRKH